MVLRQPTTRLEELQNYTLQPRVMAFNESGSVIGRSLKASLQTFSGDMIDDVALENTTPEKLGRRRQ